MTVQSEDQGDGRALVLRTEPPEASPPSAAIPVAVELQHHYGWKRYECAGATLAEAAYAAVRATHEFLDDSNHTVEIDDDRVVIRKNEKSPRFALAPRWVDDGPGALWFAVPFRARTVLAQARGDAARQERT